ncbi:MAG: SDR family NAD(P)-dependent oxidoreductase [Planctomycetota bacterium]|jgi:3-oxoacyl-[acyl-carrier protein] reductase
MSKTVLITGGSGAIGKALVRRFAEEDYRVAFTYQRKADVAGELSKETGASAFQADLTDSAQVRKAIEEATAEFEHIDVLVNNVGVTQIMPFALIDEEDWDRVIEVNLKTMFLVTREVVRGMIARKSGAIINLGSLAAHRLLDVPVHYATAKAGVSGFTIALAKELSRFNIRVNSVVPGLLSDGVGRMVPQKEKEEYLKYCTAGRPGEPAEVAELVVFLAGEKAIYINAQNLFIDGGI